jgi:hypothetical protein
MELSRTTFACPSWWLSNIVGGGNEESANRTSVLLIGRKEKTLRYLDSARSIAQSRIALRRKPQCTRSYMRIMKTVVNADSAW